MDCTKIVDRWVLEANCQYLCKIFLNPDEYENPNELIELRFDIITHHLQFCQPLNESIDKKGVYWLLLAELCLRLHTSEFDVQHDDSTSSDLKSLSHYISTLCKEFSVSDETASKLITSFNKIQEVKGKQLRSKSLKEKVDKAFEAFLKKIKIVIKEIIFKLGPSFLDQLSSIVDKTGAANKFTVNDLLNLMDEHKNNTNSDHSCETEANKSQTSPTRKGVKKLYNPSRTLQLSDLECIESQANESQESSKSNRIPLRTSPSFGESSSNLRSSPRLSVQKPSAKNATQPTFVSPGTSKQKARGSIARNLASVDNKHTASALKSPASKHHHPSDRSKEQATQAYNLRFSPMKNTTDGRSAMQVSDRNFVAQRRLRSARQQSGKQPFVQGQRSSPHDLRSSERNSKNSKARNSDEASYEIKGRGNNTNNSNDDSTVANVNDWVSESDAFGNSDITTDAEIPSYSDMAYDDDLNIDSDATGDPDLDFDSDMVIDDDTVNDSDVVVQSHDSHSLEDDNSTDMTNIETDEGVREPVDEKKYEVFEYVTESEGGMVRIRSRAPRRSNRSSTLGVGANQSFSRGEKKIVARVKPVDKQVNVKRNRESDNEDSLSDDSILEEANLLPTMAKRQKRHKFSQEEEEWIRDGVRRFGVGKWRLILDSYNFRGRTIVNLKDKWRNLVKAGLA